MYYKSVVFCKRDEGRSHGGGPWGLWPIGYADNEATIGVPSPTGLHSIILKSPPAFPVTPVTHAKEHIGEKPSANTSITTLLIA